MNIFLRSFFTTFDVDYHNQNVLMNLNFRMAMKQHPMALKDEIRAGPPKTAIVSENIDVVRERIMQERHVTYREIELSLGISPPTCIRYCMNTWP